MYVYSYRTDPIFCNIMESTLTLNIYLTIGSQIIIDYSSIYYMILTLVLFITCSNVKYTLHYILAFIKTLSKEVKVSLETKTKNILYCVLWNPLFILLSVLIYTYNSSTHVECCFSICISLFFQCQCISRI